MSDELFDKSKDNQIRQNGLIMNTDEVVDLLNSQSKLISAYMYEFAKMSKENKKLKEENEQLKESNKNSWELIKFIYNEIKEEGSMDFSRIQDLLVIDDE